MVAPGIFLAVAYGERGEKMAATKGLCVKHILVSLLLVLFLCPVVSGMATTYAIRIPNGTPLGLATTDDQGNLLLLRLPNSGSNAQLVVRKVDNTGQKVWETGLRLSMQSGQRIDSGSITRLQDGSFIVTVIRSSLDGGVRHSQEAFFIKLNRIGGIEWQKKFGGNGGDAANLGSVIALSTNHRFVAAGGVNVSDGTPRVTAASFDTEGKVQWAKTYGNFSVSPNSAQAILTFPERTKNQVVFVSGIRPPGETLIFKIHSNGNLLWSKRIQGTGLRFVSATVTIEGAYVLLFDHTPSHSIYLIRLSSAGNLVWKRNFQGSTASNIHGLIISRNGTGFAVAGTWGNEGFTATFDRAGKIISSSHVNAAIDAPGFMLESTLLTKTTGGGSLLFQLDSRAFVPSCQLFQSREMKSLAPAAVSISNYTVTSADWIPKQGSSKLRRFTPTAESDTRLCFNEEF